MKVQLDEKYAAELRQKILDVYVQEGVVGSNLRATQGLWHVSDLIYPRSTYQKILYGEKITDQAIGLWFTGKAFHQEMQRILGNKFAEVEATWKNFIAHIDHFDLVLLEIKTSRKWTVPKMPPPQYVRQSGMYAAMTNTKQVKLAVIYPTAGRKWDGSKGSTVEIQAWSLGFTDSDLKQIQQSMVATTQEIMAAIQEKNIDRLPPCPDYIDSTKGVNGVYDEKAEYAYPFYYTTIEGYPYEEKAGKPKVYKGRKTGTSAQKGFGRSRVSRVPQRRVQRGV